MLLNPHKNTSHEYWLDYFQLEFVVYISIHEYYLLVAYEFVTPSATTWTRTQFLASWIVLYKGNPMTVNQSILSTKSHRENIVRFSKINFRITSRIFLIVPRDMKLRHVLCWFDRRSVSTFPGPVFTIDLSRATYLTCSNPTEPNHIQLSRRSDEFERSVEFQGILPCSASQALKIQGNNLFLERAAHVFGVFNFFFNKGGVAWNSTDLISFLNPLTPVGERFINVRFLRVTDVITALKCGRNWKTLIRADRCNIDLPYAADLTNMQWSQQNLYLDTLTIDVAHATHSAWMEGCEAAPSSKPLQQTGMYALSCTKDNTGGGDWSDTSNKWTPEATQLKSCAYESSSQTSLAMMDNSG